MYLCSNVWRLPSPNHRVRVQTMNSYFMEFAFELFIVSTLIDADNEEQAEQYALDKLINEQGLDLMGRKYNLNIIWEGSWVE